jgi:NAD+ diphosphatase
VPVFGDASAELLCSSGFRRAGLRRREPDWIRERVLDPASVFIPVWRNQNLVIELDGSEPRAASITVEGVVSVFGDIGDIDERLAHGKFVFLGGIDERAHFAFDVSAIEAPREMVRSAGPGGGRHSRGGRAVCRFAAIGRPARTPRRLAPGIRARHAVLAFAAPLLRPLRQRDAQRRGRPYAALHRSGLPHDAFPRIDPAVIMLVTDGDRALLLPQQEFPLPGIFDIGRLR